MSSCTFAQICRALARDDSGFAIERNGHVFLWSTPQTSSPPWLQQVCSGRMLLVKGAYPNWPASLTLHSHSEPAATPCVIAPTVSPAAVQASLEQIDTCLLSSGKGTCSALLVAHNSPSQGTASPNGKH